MNTMAGSSQKTSELRVVIIGAGIGGVAAAVALQHQGIHADIYEQTSVLREVGGALVLHPLSVHLLEQWGIADQFTPVTTRVHWMVNLSPDGTIMDKEEISTADNPDEKWVDTIHRADLHGILLKQVPADSIHLSHTCTKVVDHADYAEVHFANGTSVKADLVIAADGIHSIARPLMSADTPLYSGFHACRAILPREKVLDMVNDDAVLIWHSNTTAVMLLPLRGGSQVYIDVIISSTDAQGESWSATIKASELLEKAQGFEPKLLQVISNLEGPIGDRALFDRAPLEHWSLRHITLLGDAAHPMLPAQGQGANMAIQDAAVLAELLSQRDASQLQEALHLYEAQRKPITTMYQELSRRFATPSDLIEN